jgi:hypothetical protein
VVFVVIQASETPVSDWAAPGVITTATASAPAATDAEPMRRNCFEFMS